MLESTRSVNHKSTISLEEMKTNPPDVCNEIPLEQTTSPTHVHATRSTLLPRFKRKGYKGIFNS